MNPSEINEIEKLLEKDQNQKWIKRQLMLCRGHMNCMIGINAFYLLKLYIKKKNDKIKD